MSFQSFIKFKLYWGVCLLAILSSFALGTSYFAWTLKGESEHTLAAQLGTWQKEVAQQMYRQQNSPLLDKILQHHQQSYKVLSGIYINQKRQCDYGFIHYLVNEFGPVGSVQTCYSYPSLLLGGAQSLGTLLGVFLTMIALLLVFTYRQRQAYQQQILVSKLQHQRELTDFARQTCHDMKSPLQTLQNLIKLSHLDEGTERQLLKMATQRLQTMTRILSEKADLKMDIFEDSDQVCLRDILLDFESRHPSIQWKISSVGAQEIFFSEEWARVITNVMKNACEALANRNDGIIGLSWKQRESFWLLQVADNGPGIPASVQQSLGQQLVTSGKDHGNGWGLYGAFKVAQKQGGEIDILSEEGLGTTVILKIPRNSSQALATSQYI